MVKKSVLVVTIPSDDFSIEIDGEKFYPHSGESVTFKRKMTPRDLMAMAQVANVQDKSDKPLEAAQALYEVLCPLLARRMADWDWTDDDGHLYPKPNESDDFSDTLLDLGLDEINYLVEKYNAANTPQGNEKNSQQPSSEAS